MQVECDGEAAEPRLLCFFFILWENACVGGGGDEGGDLWPVFIRLKNSIFLNFVFV